MKLEILINLTKDKSTESIATNSEIATTNNDNSNKNSIESSNSNNSNNNTNNTNDGHDEDAPEPAISNLKISLDKHNTPIKVVSVPTRNSPSPEGTIIIIITIINIYH